MAAIVSAIEIVPRMFRPQTEYRCGIRREIAATAAPEKNGPLPHLGVDYAVGRSVVIRESFSVCGSNA